MGLRCWTWTVIFFLNGPINQNDKMFEATYGYLGSITAVRFILKLSSDYLLLINNMTQI